MTHAKAHMDFINKSIDEIEAELFLRSRQYDSQIKRIATVTGITELSALFILSEIGADMSVFESDRHLCSWAGLTPANNESASKKKSTRCSKAGQYLKPLLIQCALAAVKSKKEPYFQIKYHRLAKKRGKKKAIIAIARMMLTSIYHMLSNEEDFHPDDYEATVNLSKQKPVIFTIENTIQFLREQGVDPETLKLIQQQCSAQAG
jgi:transposase